jgi:hypothetical protein
VIQRQATASKDWSPEWGIVLHGTMNDVNNTKDKPVKVMLLASFCEELCVLKTSLLLSQDDHLWDTFENFFSNCKMKFAST